jgi:hypothetical protein
MQAVKLARLIPGDLYLWSQYIACSYEWVDFIEFLGCEASQAPAHHVKVPAETLKVVLEAFAKLTSCVNPMV